MNNWTLVTSTYWLSLTRELEVIPEKLAKTVFLSESPFLNVSG